MNVSPETLSLETDEERAERQKATGVLGKGTHVECYPTEDPYVVQIQHRSACLARPYANCQTCPHSQFTLFFREDPSYKSRVVACPKWLEAGARQRSQPPDEYLPAEVSTCESKPFEFCASCPSYEDLEEMGIEKVRPGWYGRWQRLKEDSE